MAIYQLIAIFSFLSQTNLNKFHTSDNKFTSTASLDTLSLVYLLKSDFKALFESKIKISL